MFVDTNVFIFATQRTSPRFEIARKRLTDFDESQQGIFISRQVLREYLAGVTRPLVLSRPLSIDAAVRRVQWIERACQMLEDGPDVSRHLYQLLQQHPTSGRQIHDANIVATMMAHGVSRLLTDNVSDFSRFASVIEIVPLRD